MQKKNTMIYCVAFVIFVAALGYLCFAGFSENNIYFLNVSEAKAMSPDKLKQARLFGLVSQKDIQSDVNRVSFQLEDKDNAAQTIPVNFSGIVPDTFKAGAEVIVEGGMKDNGKFEAKSVITKCPSKYKKENRQS